MQNTIISERSFTQIEKEIKKENNDSLKKLLAHQYIKKAKETHDNLKIADAYYNLSEAYSHSIKGIDYADSIIQITKNLNGKKYPAQGYLQKGIQFYYSGKYSKALENYLIANKHYGAQEDDFKQLVIRHYIGLLKNKIDEDGDAFNIFKDNMTFFDQGENQKKYKRQYLKSLFAVANAYIVNNKLDSAEFYSEKGIKVSLETKDKYLYPHFLLSYGGTMMLQKNYQVALDSMLKGNSLIPNKKIPLCINYFHISAIYDSLQIKSKSLLYLEKIDSIYQKEPQVIVQARKAYELLLKRYRKEDNNIKQLETIKKLLTTDSLIKRQSQDLGKQIVEGYTTPKLISEKEKLIEKLKGEKKKEKIINLLLISFLIFLLGGIIYLIRKNLINKKRFNAILQNQNESIVQKEAASNIAKKVVKRQANDIPEEVVDTILKKLDKFENSKKFIKRQYTLSSLAKELNTNSAYLSKIINTKKETSFSQYINNLRIDYAVTQLTKDSLLRSYTIKAIAKEFGFNTTQSFTTAFHKKTGIYPSYFLKKINN